MERLHGPTQPWALKSAWASHLPDFPGSLPLQEIMVGPQFQADLSNLHLNRHGEKSKWGRGKKMKTALQSRRNLLHSQSDLVPKCSEGSGWLKVPVLCGYGQQVYRVLSGQEEVRETCLLPRALHFPRSTRALPHLAHRPLLYLV